MAYKIYETLKGVSCYIFVGILTVNVISTVFSGTSASNVSKITKGKTELPALTPNRTERLHNLMADYIATGGTTTTDNDDDEEDAFIKWRDTHTPDPSCQGRSDIRARPTALRQ